MHASTRARRSVAGVALVFLALGLFAAPAVRANDHDHAGHAETGAPGDGGRVGVLLADHGEPPLYNEWTYESFREFFQHLIDMGVIPSWLTALETGTILYDADCPACDERTGSPRLIDAWLRPHDGPAVFVPASDSLPAHYVLAGGPGFGEPDVFEHVGLSAWHEWQRMGGRSPNYDEKLAKKQAVIERLRAAFGDDVAIRVGYGIDPRIDGGRQGIREALDTLVNRDCIDTLVVAYHGVGFSDIMQTHHLRHLIAAHLESLGEGDMPIRYAEPLGTTDHYVAAIVEKVEAELALLPPDAAVAVHLSGHGLSTTMCGNYDCGADAYHRSAAELFARVQPALDAAIDRPGPTGIFHIYGDGGEGDADPDNEATSPIEALDARVAEGGWTHVIDIPYEFDSNSRDTLIILRQGYRRPQPDWNNRFESLFTYHGLQVKIANANGGETHKTDALEAVTLAALDGLITPAQRSPASTTGHHADSMTEAADPDAAHGGSGTPTSSSESDQAHWPASRTSTPHDGNHAQPTSPASRFDAIGADDDHHAAGVDAAGSHDQGESILSAAGFVDVGIRDVRCPMRMGSTVDDTVAFMQRTDMAEALMTGVSAEVAAAAWSAVREALGPYAGDDGVVLTGAAWLVTATRRS